MKIKLTTDQRNRFIYAATGLVGVVTAIYLTLVNSQLTAKADHYQAETAKTHAWLKEAANLLRQADDVRTGLDNASTALNEIEFSLVPSARLSQWTLKTVIDFTLAYGVSLTQFSTPTPGEVGSLPSFPYTAATYKMTCQAFYRDFARFLADFERKYPYFRFQKLEIKRITAEPGKAAAGGTAASPGFYLEPLEFRMELVALVAHTPQQ